MDSEDIKYSLKVAGLTQERAAEMIDITREYFGKLLKEGMPEEYIERLKKAGVQLVQKVKKSNIEVYPSEEIIKLFLQQNNKLIEMIREKDQIYEKIIKLGLDSGAIQWNAEKTGLIEKLKK